jgi:hypothetical protein
MKNPAGAYASAGFFFVRSARGGGYLHCPVLIVFSVQLATELTSWAAPRTVLQATMVRHAPTNATATSF